jgi:hypothetical protein
MAAGDRARLDSPGTMHDRKTIDAELRLLAALRRPDVPIAAKGPSAPGPVVDRAIAGESDHVIDTVGNPIGRESGDRTVEIGQETAANGTPVVPPPQLGEVEPVGRGERSQRGGE